MPISNCPNGVSAYLSALCGQPTPKDGGINYIVVAVKDIDSGAANPITDVTNVTQWQNAIDGGDVEIVGPLLSGKPLGTPNEQKTSSCNPSIVVSATHTVNVQDFNTDRDNTTFWNNLITDLAGLKFAYIDCNDDFYGWIDGAVSKVMKTHDDDSETGTARWEGPISWRRTASEGLEISPTGISNVVDGVDWS